MARICTEKEIEGPPGGPLPHNSYLVDQRNLPSPDVSRHLPAELLTSIFIRIVCDSYIDEPYISYSTPTAPSWVNVSYVCHYWRDVALNCPTFWSYIPATSLRWTQVLLARSQMAPLRISPQVTRLDPSHTRQEGRARVLSIVEQVMKHSQRIQKLCFNVESVGWEAGHQILSGFLFTRRPCLQHLDISRFNLPEGKSWFLLEEDTPALCMLRLEHCKIPWYALGPSVLTTLHLSPGGLRIHKNTMAEFLSMLRRMPHLVKLSVDCSLPSAQDFLSNGEFDTTPTISLPHLSNMSIRIAPISAAIALFSCVDIPLRTKVQLQVQTGNTSGNISTLDDFVRLGSLLAQRISQSDSPKFRLLTVGSGQQRIVLTFSTSERVECRSIHSLSYPELSDNTLLEITFFYFYPTYPILRLDLSGIRSAIPLTNIQSAHFLEPSLSLELWRDILTLLSDVRLIRFSGGRTGRMPNITSMLSLPSPHLTTSLQDGQADGGQGEIFMPALEELELYNSILKQVRGGRDPDPDVADVQDLYGAIATRKETRCRLTIERCRLLTVGRVTEDLESVGWWEGDHFRVTSNG